ncbi:MAG TPA: endonuclease/exonuclease/phosphatase family protein [Acidobacteriota bacterium]|nr:endonuclease/exonuclease/phosphatase family protein [Acidobacteriota bacterium]
MRRFTRLVVVVAIWCLGVLPVLGQHRLRIMAANTSSGPHQSYPEDGPGEQIFRAFKPEVVLIQEFNLDEGNSDNDLRAWVDRVFGSDYHVCREATGGQSSIPNGIISRWPITECGEWEDPFMSNRDFAYARIDLPGEADLWAVSVHLKASSGNDNRTRRTNEARALAEAIRQHPVPAQDYLVIGGDFNAQNRSEPFLQQLSSQVVIAAPFPQDAGNDGDTNCNRNKPYDWVLADPDLESLETAVEAADGSFPRGFVFDPSRYSQSEHDAHFAPVRRFDCGASNPDAFRNFQHMAVIRDFLLPGDGPETLWTVSQPREIDFGLRDASDAPLTDSSLSFVVHEQEIAEEAGAGSIATETNEAHASLSTIQLTSASIEGEHKDEFQLASPSAGPISDGQVLTVTWTPASNDGQVRSAQLVLQSDSQPSVLRIDLRGETMDDSPVPMGEPLDASGLTIEQSGGRVELELPQDTQLAPGTIVVIGRKSSREEFEAFWGPLPSQAVYFNGHELAGGDGFPIINGSERFRLVGRDGQPLSDFLPSDSTPARHTYQRRSTADPAFDRLPNPRSSATPGRYDGQRTGTGTLLVSEFSDAPGSGNWIFEFIELLYDTP